MITGQINLTDRPLGQNERFLRLLYPSEELTNRFTQIRKPFEAQKPLNISLDDFLKGIGESPLSLLQIGEPNSHKIIYSLTYENSSLLAEVQCSLNQRNYSLVARLFEEAYQSSIAMPHEQSS